MLSRDCSSITRTTLAGSNSWNETSMVLIDLHSFSYYQRAHRNPLIIRTWQGFFTAPFSLLPVHFFFFFLHFASQTTFYGCPRASGLMCLQRTKVSAALRWVCSQCFLEIDCYLENRSSGGSLSFAPLSIPSESVGKPLSERQFRF